MRLEFWGYSRTGGDVGTRNAVAVIASVICSTVPVQEIARRVPGAVAVVHPFGCSQVGDDLSQTRRTLVGVAANPNVRAALIVGLGCETNQARQLAARIPATKPVEVVGIQDVGGSDVAARIGIEIAERFVLEGKGEERVLHDAAGLSVGVLGLDADECVYSTVYPAVSWVVDRLVEAGARVIVGLTGRLAPAASALLERAQTDLAQERLRGLAQGFSRKAWADASQGVTTVRSWTDEERERAEREVLIAGGTEVREVVAYAERPKEPGLSLMTVPQDPVEALTGLLAGGANVILVASSRGLFSGVVAVPTLVVAPKPARPSALDEFVDHHVGTGDVALEGQRLLAALLEVASGAQCSAEREEIGQFAISQLWTPF